MLEFEVKGQEIIRNDSFEVVAGSRNYLVARFTFTEEWTGTKTAVFGKDDKRYTMLIDDNNECYVPWEAIQPPMFTVSVFCGDLVTASVADVRVVESGYQCNDTPAPPTPDVYAQIIGKLDDTLTETDAIRDDAVNQTTAIKDAAIQETGAIRDEAMAQASLATSEANRSKTEADRSQVNANLSVEQAQAAGENKQATDANRQTVEAKATETASLTEQARQYSTESKAALEEQKRLIANAPAWYFKESVEAMQAIANPKEKDICYILGDAAKSDVYAYFINDIHGEPLSAPAWVWIGDFVFTSLDKETLLGILQLSTVAVSGEYSDLVNIPKKHSAPVVLDGTGETVIWDYSESENALVTLTENKPIQIHNLYPGAEGKIQVYGGLLEIPEGERNPLYGMVEPVVGQEHAVYSFYSRDGVQKDWNMLPYKGASANVS